MTPAALAPSCIVGFRCAVCGTEVPIDTPFAWRCPNASPDADPQHVLWPVESGALESGAVESGTDESGADHELAEGPEHAERAEHPNPFVRFGPRLAWWAFARARGMTDADCTVLTEEVAGDFAITPFGPAPVSLAPDGIELWIKNETGSVAGSQKARHLLSIMLHLRAAEELGLIGGRPPLAIASCGNAALAAATLAARVRWPLRVFVPEWMDPAFGARLDALGAEVNRCPRRADDPPGDPAVHRFREAVAAGAIPFSVQGPENAYCLDGGRTIGWEMAAQAGAAEVVLERVFVQVGGGAFAACVGRGLGPAVALHPVQAVGCAPLARAWQHVVSSGLLDRPMAEWRAAMTPWEAPHSLADGILDDETYDWLAVIDAMRASGGEPVSAGEAHIRTAWERAHRCGLEVSPTGAAGLAGVLAWAERGAELRPTGRERLAVVLSGVGTGPPSPGPGDSLGSHG